MDEYQNHVIVMISGEEDCKSYIITAKRADEAFKSRYGHESMLNKY